MQFANLSPVVSTSSQTQSTLQQETFAAAYSTTAAGKHYPADVEKLGPAYVASVPDMTGASVNGVSLQAAETRLNALVNVLV